MAAPALSATIVTYRPDAALFARGVASLSRSVRRARDEGSLGEAALFVVDNGPESERGAVRSALPEWEEAGGAQLLAADQNVGYGRANNLVLDRLRSDFHLVMNPDVELDAAAIPAAIAFLREHPEVGLVAPEASDEHGKPQFLCKRYPSLWVLLLRGFAPAALRRRFARRLAHYEMRDVVAKGEPARVPLASGCFMLMRTELFRRVGGFDPRFFLYFEDYDLSMRLGREAQVAYVPRARIVHHGGEAARKGPRHVAWFVCSAWRFFATHGWKIA
jgi:GT2 family glycosyltransferase